MNCPNCGNEAINVNGKFVCLDCGIEISSAGTPASTTAPEPVVQVANHVPEPVALATDNNQNQNFFVNTGEKVIAPPPSVNAPSIKDQYLEELKKEEQSQGGSYDFSQTTSSTSPGTPVPDFPTGSDSGSSPDVEVATPSPIAELDNQSNLPTEIIGTNTEVGTIIPPAETQQLGPESSNLVEPLIPSEPVLVSEQVAAEITIDPFGASPSTETLNVLENVGLEKDPIIPLAETQPLVVESPAVVEPTFSTEPEASADSSTSGAEITLEPLESQINALLPNAMENIESQPSAPDPISTEIISPSLAPVEMDPGAIEAPISESNTLPNPFDIPGPTMQPFGDPVSTNDSNSITPDSLDVPAPVDPTPELPELEPKETVMDLQQGNTAPESYFQPSAINIKEQAVMADTTSGEASEDALVAPNEPAPAPLPVMEPSIPVPESMATQEKVSDQMPPNQGISTPPVAEIQIPTPEAQVEEPAKREDIDSLLDKYNPEATVASSSVGPSFDSVRPAQYSSYNPVPQSGEDVPVESNGIPSVASVFEGEVEDPNIAIAQNKAKSKKIKIIIGAAIGALIIMSLLGVFIFLQMSNQNELSEIEKFEQQLKAGVSTGIDEVQNMKVSFSSTIDFSAIIINENSIEPQRLIELNQLITAPYKNVGSWSLDSSGNISQQNTVGELNIVKKYIAEEKLTYVQSGGAWVKEEGRTISEIPSFFSATDRGSLFYDANIEKISYEKKIINQDGIEIYEVRLYPKKEFIEDVLKNSSKALENVSFQRINAEDLVILVQVDKDNQLYTVEIRGNVDVATDNFEGKILVNGYGNYAYDGVIIEKPVSVSSLRKSRG